MDWSIFSATFITIFLAEIGDKTQFAALTISSQTRSTLSVLLGTVLALSVAGTIGVLAGNVIGQFINPEKMKYVSGVIFIVMGIFILIKK